MQGVAICLIVLFVAVCRVDARPRDHKRRHHGEADYKDEVNSCTFMVCPKGSQCTFNSSLSDPICVCITECKSHQHPVCGSDGLIYDNHCELHRAACIKQTHIAVVQDAVCKKPTSELIGSNLNVLSNQLDREDDAKQAQDITEPTVDVTADDNDDKDDEEYEPEEDKDEVRETEDEWDVEIPTEVPCSEEGLVDLKTSILDHYRAQFSNSRDDPALPELDRKFLVSLMTNHFDSSRDSMLTKDEILSMVSRDRIGGLFKQCSLLDILRIYDKNGDKKLDPYEMYDAFDVHIVTIPEDIRQQTKVAKAGDNIVLVCGIDVEDKSNIIWQRNGMDLVDVELVDGIKVCCCQSACSNFVPFLYKKCISSVNF
ncbi:follistatin-related protein 5-like isoform X2 [Acanthaster planci]|uniref:Follistatin-related protein 5-like isoform X2 n=1 Tax=Acanthaster planci TaxID=133434 RepID=A0A8B7YRI1_ACAPL|nr:follistatin-related protein 5-like isoform X2 [Acanthaster planci]